MVGKTFIFTGAALFAAFLAASPAAAQQRQPQGPLNGVALFNMLDKNGDGVVDKTEADAAVAAAFAAVDTNNDGKLSMAEATTAVRDVAARWFGAGRNAQGPAVDNRRGSDRRGFNYRRVPPPRFNPDQRRVEPQQQPNAPRFQRPLPPRFQSPNGPGFRQPFRPRFQQPYPPRFQQRNRQPLLTPAPRNRGELRPQAPQGPQTTLPPRNRRQLQPQSPQTTPPPLGGPGNPPQQPGGNPGPQGDNRVPPAFAAIDRNGDGVITPDEFAAARNRGLLGR